MSNANLSYLDSFLAMMRERIKMNFKQMQIVIKVAEEKSFTKAARKLKISQPTLSKSILSLEKQLGVTLFNRSQSPISLTDAGEMYYKKTKSILEIYNDLMAQLNKYSNIKTRNSINIGISQFAYALMSDILPKIYKKFLSANIKIKQVNSTLEVKKMLLDGDIDIGFLVLPTNLDGLKYKAIKEQNMVLAMSKSHPLVQNFKALIDKNKKISITDLRNEKFIIPNQVHKTCPTYNKIFKNFDFLPNIFCESDTLDITSDMIASNIGISFMLPQSIKESRKADIITFDIDEPLLKRTLVLAYKKDKKLSRIEKEFLDIALQKG